MCKGIKNLKENYANNSKAFYPSVIILVIAFTLAVGFGIVTAKTYLTRAAKNSNIVSQSHHLRFAIPQKH
jgi:hypothetical protein